VREREAPDFAVTKQRGVVLLAGDDLIRSKRNVIAWRGRSQPVDVLNRAEFFPFLLPDDFDLLLKERDRPARNFEVLRVFARKNRRTARDRSRP
jgi:hypothetical protein